MFRTSESARVCALIMALTCVKCHRGGTQFSLELLEEHRLAIQELTVVGALKSLFPAREGWVILPGIEPSADVADSLRVWFDAFRIVRPDSLDQTAWTRFLSKPGEVDFDAVLGYLGTPRSSTPAGFQGFLVTFRVRGVDAAAILTSGRQMRWLAWWESAYSSAQDTATRDAVGKAGLEIAEWLDRDISQRDGSPHGAELPAGIGFYPPVPQPVAEMSSLWDRAVANAKPRLKGLGDDHVVAPDILTGPRIVSSAPRSSLALQEPFLLQRRLDTAEETGWPGIPLIKNDVHLLQAGEYIWVAGPYEQVRIAYVERVPNGSGSLTDFGPSVLFFGRPVVGAGLFSVAEVNGESRIDTANAYSREYGLSIFSGESMTLARRSGEDLFLRLGHLLPAIPGPRESVPWPMLRALPSEAPRGHWRPQLSTVPHAISGRTPLFSTQTP